MKKYFLPSAIILALGLGLAVAQNITKSVQLSQFANGPIGMDASNNVFFPAHLNSNGKSPTIAAAAGTVPTVVGNDIAGTLSGGNGATTTVTVTFGTAYGVAPACVLVSENPATSPLAYNIVATGINITSSVGTAVVNYVCSGTQ